MLREYCVSSCQFCFGLCWIKLIAIVCQKLGLAKSYRLKSKVWFKNLAEIVRIMACFNVAVLMGVLAVCSGGSGGSLGSRGKRDADDDVCYGPELGCFNNKKPFDNVDVLPSSPEEIDTKFHLYTRENVEAGRVFDFAERKSLTEASGFRSSKDTKFIVHGFTSGCNRQWVQDMKNAILSVDDCNVICVDWRKGAARPDYLQAAANTRVVGKQMALLVKDMRSVFGNQLNIHFIAFSLGAHVAGIAGYEAKNITRISGLDPAGPLFEGYDAAVRLDKSDALFVDVIHSSGDSLMDGGVGMMSTMGHVDFYPNGGRFQNGCSERFFVNVVRDIFRKRSHTVNVTTVGGDPYGSSLCNHKRVYKLYAESILPNCKFMGFKCESFEGFLNGDPECLAGPARPMGYYADSVPFDGAEEEQKFYLVTRGDVPFCANQMLAEARVERNQNKTLGKLDVRFPRNFQQGGKAGEEGKLGGGITEVFRLTRQANHRMDSGSFVRKVVAAPSGYVNGVPPSVFIRYTAYKGWFVKGKRRLDLESFSLQPLGGKRFATCGSVIRLHHGEELKMTLKNTGNELCYELS